MKALVAWLTALLGAATPAQELTPEILLLARIKVHMEQNLKRLPNYTCLQTIERSRRLKPGHKFELVDALRLEVAMVGNKELFAWPGAKNFEDRDLHELVQGGAIGNGNFGLHAYSIFLTGGPSFTHVGERDLDGRKTVRYDYRVPLLSSGYKIKSPPKEARVGYHGSFWVDARTLDLVRLEVVADDIPAELEIAQARSSIGYARVKIHDEEFLLPASSELLMVDLGGNESRNHTTFTACRQFAGESVLSFDEPPPGGTSETPAATREISLPAGLAVELQLETPVDSEQSYVGDPVTAVVTGNVKKDGAIVIPKGAQVHGRITRLERVSHGDALVNIGLRFHILQFRGSTAPFRAMLEHVGSFFDAREMKVVRGMQQTPGVPGPVFVQDSTLPPGTFLFQARGVRLNLPKGFRTLWRTTSVTVEEKK